MTDAAHMRSALGLARRVQGSTWPNPAVGCVITGRDGRVVGRAGTAPGGRPHAETRALDMAGEAARGGTAYVTLEPCSHWGKTPPCTDALIAAGIARVVVACRDPDPRVNGRGLERLRAAGIEVAEGVLAAEAERGHGGFFSRMRRGRPLVTLKLASTLDGRIATSARESKWITGEAARRAAHGLRARSDAILVGVGTVLADDPALTCRIPGARSVPLVRVVADSHLRTRLTASVVATAAETPTWMLHRTGADPERVRALNGAGVRLIEVAGTAQGAGAGIDLPAALAELGRIGINRVLAEGGAQLAAALLRADLVDRLVWFHAPGVMGGDGYPAAQAFGVDRLAGMPRFVRADVRAVGGDVMTELERA